MKIQYLGYLLLSLVLSGCYTDDFLKENKEAFYKLYGNGTTQEAVSMEFSSEGQIFILGNQYVRNQDSSAVLLIHADAEGNQLWSGKFFGKGHTTARQLLVLPNDELLVLASSRLQGASVSMPVLYKISKEGELQKEIFLEHEDNGNVISSVAEGMVLDENGTLFVLGNSRDGSRDPQRSFIKQINIDTGIELNKRGFSNSPGMESKSIMRYKDKLLVIGDTRQEAGEYLNKNIFLGTFSTDLVEEGHQLLGSPADDTYKMAVFSARNELVILSFKESDTSSQSGGMVNFLSSHTLAVIRKVPVFGAGEIPVAIQEDPNGDFYVAVDAFGEKGNSRIRINKIDRAGIPLWEAPWEIAGEGDNHFAQIKFQGDFVYMLKTIDMQNENALISLSRLRL